MDNRSIAVLKGLSLDIIQNAKAGHPGSCLSSAPILYTLFTKHLKVNPKNPDWINRDRFVLSSGHTSPLLYSMLYLCGYQISVDDLRNFRKFNSGTPAYPEIKTLGVEVTTGMHAQGLATSVGLALAEKIYAQKYNKKPKNSFDKKTKPLFNYYTYVLASDADMMEGLSYEAASFASHLKLNKLIVLYDSNKMTMDGSTDLTFSENVVSRFSSMGWHTQIVKNGNSVSDINKAIINAKKSKMPSLIQINTKIGDGSVLENTNKIHFGELTKEDYENIKKKLKIEGMPFLPDKEGADYIRDQVLKRAELEYTNYEKIYSEYKQELDQNQITQIENITYNNLYLDLSKLNLQINPEAKETLRDSNSKILNIIANNFYNIIGASDDTVGSTKAYLYDKGDITFNNFNARNIRLGLRENLMGAVVNGLALSGFRPVASTYLANSDYMITSIRNTALMNLPVTYIFTHDSITTGADGPSKQPIEQLAHFRAMPNINVYRPADIKEIIGTWQCIMQDKKPSIITLARTEVKPQNGTNANNVSKGAYIESEATGHIDAVIIATGAEVQVANSIQERLKHDGINIRVISMPCMEKFLEANDGYKSELFPYDAEVFVIEYESSLGWEKFVVDSDHLFTVDKFGVSASKEDSLKYQGVDIDSIIEKIKNIL
ncbi:MAG: transketolase [Bacilli bacterium]|nr:transketolase [Bacilli bacterium]